MVQLYFLPTYIRHLNIYKTLRKNVFEACSLNGRCEAPHGIYQQIQHKVQIAIGSSKIIFNALPCS